MSINFFKAIENGFIWVGKELQKAVIWVPKLVVLADDVEDDANTILPGIAAVIDDSAAVVGAAVKDSGSDIAAAEALAVAISAAAAAGLTNILADESVVSAFEGFIKVVTTSSNYTDLLTAIKKLTVDYEALGSNVKTALVKLENDAK